MNRCVQCEGKLEAASTRRSLDIAGRQFSADVPGWRCRACREEYNSGPALIRFERAVAADLAEHGPVRGDAFSFMRRVLPLTGVELGKLLNVSPETISRWENGKREIDRSAWLTLGALVLDALHGQTSTRDRIEGLGKRPARKVRLRLNRSAA